MIERASIATAIVLAIFAWTWTSDTGYVFDHGNQLVHLVELNRALDPAFLAHDWFLNAGGEGVRHVYLGTSPRCPGSVGIPNAVLLLWVVQIALLAIAGYSSAGRFTATAPPDTSRRPSASWSPAPRSPTTGWCEAI